MHRMSVEKLDKDSKADRVVRMVTPWHSRIVRDSEALSTMLSPCLDRGIQLIQVCGCMTMNEDAGWSARCVNIT